MTNIRVDFIPTKKKRSMIIIIEFRYAVICVINKSNVCLFFDKEIVLVHGLSAT